MQNFSDFFDKNFKNAVLLTLGSLIFFLVISALANVSDVRIKKAWLDNKIPFDYRIEDCFSTNTSNFIITLLKENKCLLLCDGGNKVEEFNFFSQFITSGSYIMAHDYSTDKNYFDKNIRDKVWNWLEIEDADIMSSVYNYNLTKPEYYEKFKDVVWVCYKK
jgi:hypothetical protein